MSSRSRLGGGDPYSFKENQKELINSLVEMIYANYETSAKLQSKLDSIHRMLVFLVICVVLFLLAGLVVVCYYGCRRRDTHSLPQSSPDATVSQTRPRYHYQSERGVSSPLHQPRKSAPIEL